MIENPNVICNDCGFGKQNKELKDKCERLEKKLKIALAAFRMIRYSHNTIKDRKTREVYYTWHYAEMKIKELEK